MLQDQDNTMPGHCTIHRWRIANMGTRKKSREINSRFRSKCRAKGRTLYSFCQRHRKFPSTFRCVKLLPWSNACMHAWIAACILISTFLFWRRNHMHASRSLKLDTTSRTWLRIRVHVQGWCTSSTRRKCWLPVSSTSMSIFFFPCSQHYFWLTLSQYISKSRFKLWVCTH